MDRLLIIDPREIIMHFEVGEKCQTSIHLKNVMHTMPVAYNVQAIPPKKYIIKPLYGIIPPLGVAGVEITLCPQNEIPESAPRSRDQFFVNSVVVPGGFNNPSVMPEWFTAKKKQVFSDHGMQIFLIGGCILRKLVERGSMENIREVLELDEALVNSQDHQGRTPVHIAVASRRPELVQLLLEFNSSLEIKNALGQAALHEAVLQKDTLIVEILLARGAVVDSRNASGCTPLHVAVMQQHAVMARLLIENGADADAVMDDGRTALHVAVQKGRHDCIAALLEMGAQPDVCWRGSDETPLHIAVSRGDDKALELLLKHGARRDVCNRNGQTAKDVAAALKNGRQFAMLNELALAAELRIAAQRGKLEDVQVSLRNGAQINGRDDHGWTALHLAAFKGHRDVVSCLINEGANLKSKDDAGYTALHCAIEAGQRDIMRLLVKHGAPLDACTKYGVSAFDLATCYNYMEDIEVIVGSEDIDKLVRRRAHNVGGLELKIEKLESEECNMKNNYVCKELSSATNSSIALKLSMSSFFGAKAMVETD